MMGPEQEQQLVIVAVAVVVFTILAIISFLAGLNSIIFYVFAILAIALGFYLSFTLSKERPTEQQANKKKK